MIKVSADAPVFSVVIPTLGRSDEVVRLLDSLDRQSVKSLEVIIVDQNDDETLTAKLAKKKWEFSVRHLRTPGQRGACRGRNVGWRQARGSIIVFADDDCWYPPWTFDKCQKIFDATGADVVAGRAAANDGRSINGRFENAARWIDRSNVWTTSIEWMIFFHRDVLRSVEGFDEGIGIGAPTPWQSAEGQDALLRMLAAGYRCYFDPELYGFHAEILVGSPDASVRAKALAYGRGMGFVLQKHGYGWVATSRWILRPLAGVLVSALMGRQALASYYFNVALGRWQGLRRSVPNSSKGPGFGNELSRL